MDAKKRIELINELEEYLSRQADHREDGDSAFGLGAQHLTVGDVKDLLTVLREDPDTTWNAAIDSAEHVVKERAAELKERSQRPLYAAAQRIRSLLRIRPEDRAQSLSDQEHDA